MENNDTQIPPAGKDSPGNGIVFDTASGFSAEEQQEILDKINSISVEKGLVPPEGQVKSEARKRGIMFPVLVNIAAVLLLAGGFILLWTFHSKGEQEIRLGSGALGITERKLIQEIRSDTNQKLAEKDNQISEIQSRLAAAAAEYRQLQQSMENLSDEQKNRADYLAGVQDEYQNSLSQLQNDRTAILEDARARETGLRVQAEENAKNLSSQIEQSQANLGAAMQELSRLSNEQDRAAAAEDQLGGLYSMADSYISSGDFGSAASTLASMKDFLNNPVFSGSRSMEARRQTHLAVLGTLEDAVAAQVKAGSAGQNINTAGQISQEESSALIAQSTAPLQSRITELEQARDAQQRIIDALNSQDSSRSQILAEYDNMINNQQNMLADLRTQITSLQNANSNQQQSLGQRDSTISDLKDQITAQDQRIDQINTAAAALEQQITQLNTAASARDQQITQLTASVASRDQQITQLNTAAAARDQQISALNTSNGQLQSRVDEMSQANDNLRSQINSVPTAVEQAIENPNVQALLGPQARRDLLTVIQQAIQQVVQ